MQCFFAFGLLLAVGLVAARPDHYTDKYDNIDLDEILDNRRLLVPYLNCVLEKGTCTPDGKELKVHIKEALEEDCGKCTEKQKNGSKKVIKHIYHNEPEYWKQLTAKYDPEMIYYKKYQKELE